MSRSLLEVLMVLGGVAGLLGIVLGSVFVVNYRVTPRHLHITWLGLPVRRIRLDNIKHISTKRSFWAERWPNTWRARNRLLVIHKHRGWLKQVAITPASPFVFKAELDRARKAAGAPVPGWREFAAETAATDPAPSHRNAA